LIASPDAAAAALVASSLGGLAVAGDEEYLTLALAQAILCGLLLVLAAVFKLGFLASFLSKPILVGFVGGLALDILVSQTAKMLGIRIDSGADFVPKVIALVDGLASTNGWAVLLSAGTITVLLLGRRLARVVPWALVALILSTAFVGALNLQDAGVAVLGPVDAGPPTLAWPTISWTLWLQLIPSAIALSMVTMTEGLLVSRSYGEKRGYTTRPNRDLLAFGAANLAAGTSGGFTIGSSTSRTAALDQAGSRSQFPTLVAAAGALALVLFGTSLLENIPSSAIGAVVAVAVAPLLGLREFGSLWKLEKFEFAVGATCFLGTLLVGPIGGILLAFVLALINLARRAANPAMDVLGSDDSPHEAYTGAAGTGAVTAPGIIVFRFAAPLFFANAAAFQDSIQRAVTATGFDQVQHLVLDCEAVTDLDVTGSESLRATFAWLDAHQVQVSFSRLRPDLQRRLKGFQLLTGTVYRTNRAAIAALSPSSN
jgi:MFS superfamily sulfate permease-like transporter